MNKQIEDYTSSILSIYILRKTNDNPNDVLIALFDELMDIIFYKHFDDLVNYANKIYNLNIPVSKYDILGSRIKIFILLYINDVIPKSLEDEL